jgi:predicted ATP-grasp superfamily ATP-dependent carboligase
MRVIDCVIVGAGPYGLSAAAHLREAGVDAEVYGDPMSFWRSMPKGMLLRSNWTATSIADYRGPHSLDAYSAETAHRPGKPVPLDDFIDYGMWVQRRVATDVIVESIERIEPVAGGFELRVGNGERVRARRVVVAGGIAPFALRPSGFGHLSPEVVSHASDHRDLGAFAGRSVLVVGGGQSALESAALMHEAGADVEVAVRSPIVHWLHGGKYNRRLGRFAPLLYAPTDVGPMGLSRLVAATDGFRRLPHALQEPMAHRCIRPAGAAWLVPRLADVPILLGRAVRRATPAGDAVDVEFDDGTTRHVDHILCGTGYRVDVARYPFLSPELVKRIRTVDGYPVLRPGLESSVPGLHILGAPAARSFGPTMRFVSGSWYAGRSLTRSVTGRSARPTAPSRSPRTAESNGSRLPTPVAAQRGPRLAGGARIGAVVLGGDYQGLGIARSLGRRGVPVCVVDDEVSIARASRFAETTIRVPSLRDEASTLDALGAAASRGCEGWVLFPTRDETVAAIARNRPSLARTFRVPTPEWDSVRSAWDKRETYRLADRLGIPTPRTWFPFDGAATPSAAAGDGPFVVKPAIKEHFFYAARAKAWRADDVEGLERLVRRAAEIAGPDEVIVQELIPGEGGQQFSYCAMFKDGAPLASMTVRRRRQHPSDFGRASTMVETVDVPELEEPSTAFLSAIGYYGLAELEYKLDPRDGRFKLLDVNARTWGYHSLGAVAGVDFAYLLFQDQIGAAVQGGRAAAGRRWIRVATDVPNAVKDIRAGTLRAADYLRSLRGLDTEAVFSIADPLPGLFELVLLPYLLVKRGL